MLDNETLRKKLWEAEEELIKLRKKHVEVLVVHKILANNAIAALHQTACIIPVAAEVSQLFGRNIDKIRSYVLQHKEQFDYMKQYAESIET